MSSPSKTSANDLKAENWKIIKQISFIILLTCEVIKLPRVSTRIFSIRDHFLAQDGHNKIQTLPIQVGHNSASTIMNNNGGERYAIIDNWECKKSNLDHGFTYLYCSKYQCEYRLEVFMLASNKPYPSKFDQSSGVKSQRPRRPACRLQAQEDCLGILQGKKYVTTCLISLIKEAFSFEHKSALHFKLLVVIIMNFGHGIVDHSVYYWPFLAIKGE
uniref:Uncharacterized protein n=1 Tax=Romanomermis culicivorax TaxID=13658 RepID=A0A915K981_ROMCU